MAKIIYESWEKYIGHQQFQVLDEDGCHIGWATISNIKNQDNFGVISITPIPSVIAEVSFESLPFDITSVRLRLPDGVITDQIILEKDYSFDEIYTIGESYMPWQHKRNIMNTLSKFKGEVVLHPRKIGSIVNTGHGKVFQPEYTQAEMNVLWEARRRDKFLLKAVSFYRCEYTGSLHGNFVAAFSKSKQTISIAIRPSIAEKFDIPTSLTGERLNCYQNCTWLSETSHSPEEDYGSALVAIEDAELVHITPYSKLVIESDDGRTWWFDKSCVVPIGEGDILRPPRPREAAQILVMTGRNYREEETNRKSLDHCQNSASA